MHSDGTLIVRQLSLDLIYRHHLDDNANVFISDLWPIRPNRQLGLHADIHERKIQGYARTQ